MIANTSIIGEGALTITAAATQALGLDTDKTSFDLSDKATWGTASLHVKLTNPATAAKESEALDLYYAVTAFANPTVDQLRPLAKRITIPIRSTANAITLASTPLFSTNGAGLYFWFAHAPWSGSRSVEVNIVGMP